MGQFSWYTQDENLPLWIWDSRFPSTKRGVYLTNGKNHWYEPMYSGYGVFGNKDFFVLLYEMNHLFCRPMTEEMCNDPEYDRRRDWGINHETDPHVRFPNIVRDISDWNFNALLLPKAHRDQGCYTP